MIDLDNQTSLAIDSQKLEHIATSLSPKPIELIIMNAQNIQSINEQHRGKAQSTDVLSFPIDSPFEDKAFMPLGTIIICDDFVKKGAENFGHSLQDELSLLFIHGLLHLLGFDHEIDNGQMREKEHEVIKAFDLPKSLIIRIQEY
jgi:probable rRNA maturation factor